MPFPNVFSVPALPTSKMSSFLTSVTVPGNTILSASGFPQQPFPSIDGLGLSDVLDTSSVFPFKNNSIGLTDIEVASTILVLGGAKQNQIKYQTNKFILQSIVKPLQERFQIIETFGESSINFFDKRTRIYTVQGVLFDAEDPTQLQNPGGTPLADSQKSVNYWATAFQDFFETALRGTKLIQAGQIAALYVNNWYIKGYPLQLTITKSSETLPQTCGFQMTWVIKDETLLSSSIAQNLWSKSKYSPGTMTALNNYVDALNTYEAAYNAFASANGNPAVPDMATLISARDEASAAVSKAQVIVEVSLAKDANASQGG